MSGGILTRYRPLSPDPESDFVPQAQVGESRAILAEHRDEIPIAHVLDLGIYEFGNVLLRALRRSAEDTADQIEDLLVICGPPLVAEPQ